MFISDYYTRSSVQRSRPLTTPGSSGAPVVNVDDSGESDSRRLPSSPPLSLYCRTPQSARTRETVDVTSSPSNPNRSPAPTSRVARWEPPAGIERKGPWRRKRLTRFHVYRYGLRVWDVREDLEKRACIQCIDADSERVYIYGIKSITHAINQLISAWDRQVWESRRRW